MLDTFSLLAQAAPAVGGSITLAIAGGSAAIAIGLIGMGAVQAVARNPTAFGNILTIAILGMALAEAIAIYAFLRAIAGA